MVALDYGSHLSCRFRQQEMVSTSRTIRILVEIVAIAVLPSSNEVDGTKEEGVTNGSPE